MGDADGSKARILVVGGGPAGLLTAQALQMQGAHVSVFEQDAALDARPRDWNFGIYWAQDPLQECLPKHLQGEVEDAQVDERRAGEDETMPIFNGLTAELLKTVPIPYNIRLARKRFLRLISTGLDIQYGKKLKQVSSDGQHATAVFEDGSSETGDLLIGAEGAHSHVREFLVGPDKAALNPSPLVATATMAKLPADAARKFLELGRRLSVTFHPAGYFCWIGVHNAHNDSQPGDWTFMIILSWKPSDPSYEPTMLQGNETILVDLKRRAEDFHPSIKFILQSIPDGTQCWHNRLSSWQPEAWDNRNGTVTLVGDAAHPMTFHRGQGLNNAIRDVALLARCVREHGSFASAAIAAYEAEMIPRAREAVELSNVNSTAVHDWATLLQSPLFTTGMKQK